MNINKMHICCLFSISLLVLSINAYAFENQTKEIVRNVKTIKCPELPVSTEIVSKIDPAPNTVNYWLVWSTAIREPGDKYSFVKANIQVISTIVDLICFGTLTKTNQGKPVKINIEMRGSVYGYTCLLPKGSDTFTCTSK